MSEYRDEFLGLVEAAKAKHASDTETAAHARQEAARLAAEQSAKLGELVVIKNFVITELDRRGKRPNRVLIKSSPNRHRPQYEWARGWKVDELQFPIAADYNDKGNLMSPAHTDVSGYLIGVDTHIRQYSGTLSSQPGEKGFVRLAPQSDAQPIAETDPALLGRFANGLAELVARKNIVIPEL